MNIRGLLAPNIHGGTEAGALYEDYKIRVELRADACKILQD